MSTLHSWATPFDSRRVGGVPFQVTTLSDAANWIINDAATDHIAVNVRLVNAYNVALAASESSYFDLLTNRGINLPDGAPVVWFMNHRERRQRDRAERVRGPSLFQEVMKRSSGTGVRHFLLGSTDETLDALRKELSEKYPTTIIAGTYSPPFAPITDDYLIDCVRAVRESKPDLLWLGLGTPKQDQLGSALSEATNVTTINVGAAFDFVAGTVREAPRWIQNSGFEWLFRFAAEPRRLWRRYIFGNTRFLVAALGGQRRTASDPV